MRLIHTEPMERVLAREQAFYTAAHDCVKKASDATTTHALSGELYASKSGWILLSVPNALVRGAFDALNEPGVELPPQSSGKLNAHISVMRPDEIERIGGVDKVSERGHHFHYTLGPVQEASPAGWDEMSKVWFIQVRSTELQDLRKAYGLSPRPNDNKFDFHITIGVRRKNVLRHNDVAKAAGILPLLNAASTAASVADIVSPVDAPVVSDPAMDVMDDDEHLEEMRKKHTMTQGINSVITENTNGLPSLQTESKVAADQEASPQGQAEVRHVDNAASPVSDMPSDEEDFACKEEELNAIYAYYDGTAKTADAVDLDDDDDREKTWQDHLLTAGLPIGAAGAAGLALRKPTNTLVPAQTTQFPNDPKPHLIRGGIYPGARASVLDDTGGGYMAVGPAASHDLVTGENVPQPRLHAHINNPDTFRSAMQGQQRPGAPLQQLEIHGHGAITGQDLGDSHLNPRNQLGPLTVNHVADTLNSIPKAPNSTVTGYGCNTGLCKPEFSWWQRLADRTGMTALGARGYVTAERDGGLWQDVSATARGTWPRILPQTHRGRTVNDPGQDNAFTRHRPHQPQDVIHTQTDDTTSKRTWGALPANKLHELLYNIGRPSAALGALAPLLGDKTTARNTALGATALTAPMVLSEILGRHGQAQADISTGRAPNTLGTHLSAQSKVLPYLGMAALPLLSYGGANMLGRWKDKEEEKKK